MQNMAAMRNKPRGILDNMEKEKKMTAIMT